MLAKRPSPTPSGKTPVGTDFAERDCIDRACLCDLVDSARSTGGTPFGVIRAGCLAAGAAPRVGLGQAQYLVRRWWFVARGRYIPSPTPRRFACSPASSSILTSLTQLPLHLFASINVNRPPSEVFAALAHDPANWRTPPASTELGVSILRLRTALALTTQSGPSALRLTNSYSSGMRAVGLRSVSTPRPHRRFMPGLRTTALSQTTTVALCCALPSVASRDWLSSWPLSILQPVFTRLMNAAWVTTSNVAAGSRPRQPADDIHGLGGGTRVRPSS